MKRRYLTPFPSVGAVDVDEREDGQEGNVQGGEDGVREVRGQWGAEEDLEGEDYGGGEECEGQGNECCLPNYQYLNNLMIL